MVSLIRELFNKINNLSYYFSHKKCFELCVWIHSFSPTETKIEKSLSKIY